MVVVAAEEAEQEALTFTLQPGPAHGTTALATVLAAALRDRCGCPRGDSIRLV